jgi:hypothetical protein
VKTEYFKKLAWHSREGNEENLEKLIRNIRSLDRNSNPGHSKYGGAPAIRPQRWCLVFLAFGLPPHFVLHYV